MAGHECYHCKQWVEAGEAHNCWTTTEAALTGVLSEDLQEAYARIRETAVEFGEQRIYASLNSIMFAKTVCYTFVRPKKSFLELVVFLGRPLKSPQVRRAMPASKTKFANLVQIRHRDEVEAPITDWMREAYEQSDALSARPGTRTSPPAKAQAKTRSRTKTQTRAKFTSSKTKRPPTKRAHAKTKPSRRVHKRGSRRSS